MVAPLALMGLASVAGEAVGGFVKGLTGGSKTEKVQKTAKDFEQVFLEDVMNRMGEGLGEEGPLGGGSDGGSVYRSMLMKEYAGQITKSGGVGIADAVYRQLMKLQEG
jgi:flagellar protein FlgJ